MDIKHSGSLASRARTGFVKKVYTVLSLQLAFTTIFVGYSLQSRYLTSVFQESFFWWVTALISSIVSLFFLVASQKNFPLQTAFTALLTLGESYLVGTICTYYEPKGVILAAAATMMATLGITFFAFVTNTDFTKFSHSIGAFTSSFIWVALGVSLMNIVFIGSSFLQSAIAIVFACIYSVYILYDTQKIMGGKEKEVSLDNYYQGAATLYMDIISLFIKILQILGERKKKDK